MYKGLVLFLVIYFLSGFLSPLYSQYKILNYRELDKNYIQKKFTRQQVAEDIRTIIDYFNKTHPNPYHSITQERLELFSQKIESDLPDTLSVYECMFAISSFMSAFNEAHLGLTTNSLLWNDYYKNGKEFPFSIFDYTDKTLIVNDDLSGKARLQMFDRIISINNIPVSVLIDKYERLFGGLSSWRKYQFSNMFSFLLYADKIYPPFTIQAKSKGKMISFTTEGSPQKKEKEVENQNFTLNISDSIAYLNFFTMTGSLQTFNDSLKLAFSTLKRQKIKYLIVDLRNNNGGDSRMGDILLSYFNTKPYRMTSSGHLLVSSAFKKANLHFLPLYKKIAILLIPNGVLINLKQYEIIPYASEPFFDGKVCVLIGKGTFSSANMLANAIKDYNLAYLIGETTAESANDYGDMISFMLPNTQLIGRVPCKKFTRANGDVNNNEGIFPDLEVIPLPSQQFAGEDVVKKAAINWLKDNYETPVIY